MTLSSRLAVMDQGNIEQIGTPDEIYEFPANRFVADFIGNANMFESTVVSRQDGILRCSNGVLGELDIPSQLELEPGTQVCLAIRPEKIYIDTDQPGDPERQCLPGVVYDMGYFGNLTLYRVKTADGQVIEVSRQNRRRGATRRINWDDTVIMSWDAASVAVLQK